MHHDPSAAPPSRTDAFQSESLTGLRSARRRGDRPTIAVLVDYMDVFGDGYESQLRRAFDVTCQRRDLNLVFVFGKGLAGPPAWYAGYNSIYELLNPECVDGIVLLSASLASYAGLEAVSRFSQRYHPMPRCSFGAALRGVPSLVVDERSGMEAMVDHLLGEHGCRRLAFIGGPPENPDAQVRLDAYRCVLERHGIPFDPNLVINGSFCSTRGRFELDQMLRRGITPDGVVAANDGMALGAIRALRMRGFRVPRDLPVTGFDDLLLARLGNPPLTTVAQPFDDMVEMAIELLLDQLAGCAVPLQTSFSAKTVIRESCGCNARAARQRPCQRAVTNRSTLELSSEHVPRLETALRADEVARRSGVAEDAIVLLEALRAEAGGNPDAFLSTLEGILEQRENDEDHQQLASALHRLSEHCRALGIIDFESLCNEARNMIATARARIHAQRRSRTAETSTGLLTLGEQFSLAVDLQSLREALIDGLNVMGVTSASFALYVEGNPGELEPFLCMIDGRLHRASMASFPAHRLFLPDVYPPDRRYTWLLFPLAFETHRLGIAVFEYRAGIEGYQMLRDEFCTGLRSVALLKEVAHKSTLHERSVQERLATAKRMDALSILAGGVAHDLNNALGPLVALPDVLLSELDKNHRGDLPGIADLRGDLESIKAASLRASQTIKDLLTLSRQGRTSKEILDLNQAVKGCLEAEPLRCLEAKASEPTVTLDLHSAPLLVRASESHLLRAIANLVRNAVEALDQGGEIVVQTRTLTLEQPLAGYEIVPPGEYATVSVADSGAGITVLDIGHVFEPFFSKKRLGENSGSGLGLAIVHGVVKDHDGYVNVWSAVGHGTTFTLYLPKATEVRQSRHPPPVLVGGHARILVVDDEPGQLRTARRVLTHLGYEVETLDSAYRAHECFAAAEAELSERASTAAVWRSPFDLVIADMTLGEEMDGLELVERVRQLFPAQRAIIASGHAPPERAENAIQKGLAWLVKPYTSEALARAVGAALARPSIAVDKVRSEPAQAAPTLRVVGR